MRPDVIGRWLHPGLWLFAGALFTLSGGCGGSKAKPSAANNGDALRQSLAHPGSGAGVSNQKQPRNAASVARSVMPNTANGLEVRKWTVLDQRGRFFPSIARHMHGSAVDPDMQARLERNGFRLVRVRLDDLDGLLNDLGGANLDLNEWHGQATDWRPVQQRPVGGAPRALAIDGKVSRYDSGVFNLNIRAWTVQMEDGPRLQLEMLPRRDLPQTNDLRRMLGEPRPPRYEAFPSVALDLQLQAGFAYVLFGEQPQVPWPERNSDDGAVELEAPLEAVSAAPAPSPSLSPLRPSSRRSKGPQDFSETSALAPVTLGEFLLIGDRQPVMRGLIVFIPRIAPELFAPEFTPGQTAPMQAITPANQDVSAKKKSGDRERPSVAGAAKKALSGNKGG